MNNIISVLTIGLVASAGAAQLSIQLEAPSNLGIAPGYAAFHNGSYDIFDTGSAASAGLEQLAEVGSSATLAANTPSGVQALTIANGGPFFPGNSNTVTLDVDSSNTMLSFVAMVLPSNDWFVGNNVAIDISSLLSGDVGTSISWDFATVYDAGTETEDFAFAPGGGIIGIDTASDPAGGTVTSDLITAVTASDPFSSFANISPGTFDSSIYDFNDSGFSGPIARLTITRVPEPTSSALLGLGGIALLARRQRQTHS